jgi:hypothetical protein
MRWSKQVKLGTFCVPVFSPSRCSTPVGASFVSGLKRGLNSGCHRSFDHPSSWATGLLAYWARHGDQPPIRSSITAQPWLSLVILVERCTSARSKEWVAVCHVIEAPIVNRVYRLQPHNPMASCPRPGRVHSIPHSPTDPSRTEPGPGSSRSVTSRTLKRTIVFPFSVATHLALQQRSGAQPLRNVSSWYEHDGI